MSRIGKKPIDIPQGVEVKIDGSLVTVKGPKGTLSQSFNACMSYELKDNQLTVKRPDDEIKTKMLHGTTRALINDMVLGVTKGFQKTLKLVGIGYAATMKGKDLQLKIGYAIPVIVSPIEGVEISTTDDLTVVVKGIDAQKVGQMAATIRAIKKPEPYHGKGIRYADEVIVLRVSKAKKKESAGATAGASK